MMNPIGHTAYHHVGHTAYHHVGEITVIDSSRTIGYAAMGLAAYHGYRRHGGSVGWAAGFALLAGLVPWFTLGVVAGQGFAKKKGR